MSETAPNPNNRAVVYRGKPQREKPRMSGFGVAPQAQNDPDAKADETSGQMPWNAKQFAQRHNKSLSPSEAKGAARQANAILRSGGDEGIAIATANKRINKLRKRGVISGRQHEKLEGKYGGKDQEGIDAASR